MIINMWIFNKRNLRSPFDEGDPNEIRSPCEGKIDEVILFNFSVFPEDDDCFVGSHHSPRTKSHKSLLLLFIFTDTPDVVTIFLSSLLLGIILVLLVLLIIILVHKLLTASQLLLVLLTLFHWNELECRNLHDEGRAGTSLQFDDPEPALW